MPFPRWVVIYGMECRSGAHKPERGRFLREYGHRTRSLHAGLRRDAEIERSSVLSLCPAELRLMALWMVVRPKTTKRKGFVVLRYL